MRPFRAITVGALAIIALFLAGGTASASPVDGLERDDSLVLSVAWRLETGNARYCPHVTPQTGIQLEDAAVYADPALARSTYHLTGDIYVGALAAHGPGTAAGLAVNDTVAAIDGQPLSALPVPRRSDPFTRWHLAQAMLDSTAARDGAVNVKLGDGRTVAVTATPACRITVKVDDQMSYANATRDEIRIGRHYVDAAHGDVTLIAAMLAHEMAHAVLDHQTRLEASNRAIDVVRRTEHEADRLSVWLLANAGYPPDAAVALQAKVVSGLIGPFSIDPAHGSWQSRAQRIQAEIAVLHAAPDADWPHRFQRENT